MTAGQLVALAVPAAGVAWVVRAWFWPFAPCRRCGGSGQSRGSTGRRWGRCPRCEGSGRRMVLGARQLQRARLRAQARRGK